MGKKEDDAYFKAKAKRDNLDFQGLSMLERILKMVDWDNGKQRFLQILADYHGCQPEHMQEILDEAKRIINEREEAHEEFIRAIANLNN